ncbi:lasso peptide biosynthesis B2 protein [Aurantiacibacter sp. MUD11]|uniref:lasso peptide biosynthesis B2 protein n=1 Tax=Aurantiacibacter sp. MUD11 TaxID=3003265 RepID=UPI0022AA53FA|nr:lasso peptide biosynthesis B2 protein [Aurantiacibacter sp. MUD11]WAT17022.1 lasso peptide biosynthesis B2 protein [Aurantiacibacter sp. MUD11]
MAFRRYAAIPGFEARSVLIRWVAMVRFAVRAICELARGRLAFARNAPSAFVRNNRNIAASGRSPENAFPGDELLARQVSFMIPRIARRVPWRSDCLVQALAAQKWLESAGIASNLTIGVEKSGGGDFNAHAWLTYGDKVVTGGEIDAYEVLLG